MNDQQPDVRWCILETLRCTPKGLAAQELLKRKRQPAESAPSRDKTNSKSRRIQINSHTLHDDAKCLMHCVCGLVGWSDGNMRVRFYECEMKSETSAGVIMHSHHADASSLGGVINAKGNKHLGRWESAPRFMRNCTHSSFRRSPNEAHLCQMKHTGLCVPKNNGEAFSQKISRPLWANALLVLIKTWDNIFSGMHSPGSRREKKKLIKLEMFFL
jgi:hypothetical protein